MNQRDSTNYQKMSVASPNGRFNGAATSDQFEFVGRLASSLLCRPRLKVGKLAQGLLELDLPGGSPLVVLSENDIDRALLSLAAMHVGIPVSTISVAYSQSAGDCAKLGAILGALKPGAVFVTDGQRYARALSLTQLACPVIVGRHANQVQGAIALKTLLARNETPDVMAAFGRLGPDHHARYLLTSGSTGAEYVKKRGLDSERFYANAFV
jgi:feruloyl-CoA synthase